MARNIREARRVFSPKLLLIKWYKQLDEVEKRCTQRHWHQLNYADRMIVVLEDKRYLRHRGIDWRSVARILCQQAVKRRRGGASTIEMQLIRTVLNLRQKTLTRKLNEAVLAWLINFRVDKISLLYSYGQLAYFGSHLEGVDAASRSMFSKEADQLTLEEAALIASMLVYPKPTIETPEWRRRVNQRAKYGLSIYRRLEQRHEKITK